MKIAILYSGMIRTLPHTIKNNLQYFDYANIDLYFSTWNYSKYSDKMDSPDFVMSERSLDQNIIITEEVIENIVNKQANIKKIKIEKYNSAKYNLNIINGIDNQGSHAQYYKVFDCCNLLDDTNYDAIVRLRCDILLNNKIGQKDLQQLVVKDKIIFANKIWYNHIWNENIRSINDMVWISNKELMKKSCNIYLNSSKINNIINTRKMTETNHGESLCYMNLECENIIGNIYTFDFNYNILR